MWYLAFNDTQLCYLIMCRWVSFNKAAASAIKSLPQGQAGLDSRYTNQVTDVFKAANQYGFTAVRLFLHGEDSSFQLQTGPGEVKSPIKPHIPEFRTSEILRIAV